MSAGLTATAPGTAADRRLRIAVAVLGVIGIGIAGYLTYVHYAGLKVVCLSSGGCETVQSSRFAKLDGIPVALLGLVGYVAILLSLVLAGDAGRVAGFGLALIGFMFSMYLTYRELFTIKAICQWCVSSAVLMTALVILTAIRVLRTEPPGREPADAPPEEMPLAEGAPPSASEAAAEGVPPAASQRSSLP